MAQSTAPPAVVPAEADLAKLAALLNPAKRVTILAGAGCAAAGWAAAAMAAAGAMVCVWPLGFVIVTVFVTLLTTTVLWTLL